MKLAAHDHKVYSSKTPSRTIHFIWNEPDIGHRFQSAVSLHSHTSHSREGLGMVPTYARSNPVVGFALDRLRSEYRRLAGTELDFSSAYYVPPLSARAAYAVEAGQIENVLGIRPFVSITDHDTIAAARQLRVFLDAGRVPISLEWTVPFGTTYFHLGLHNLPPDKAGDIVQNLRSMRCYRCRSLDTSCDGRHDPVSLPNPHDLLATLAGYPDALVVLNHPLWDACGIGRAVHQSLLGSFLAQYGQYIHAIELNGLRSWDENTRAMQLAEQWRLPLISGGDRHGCEPSAILNLTEAETFPEFVHEIRASRSVLLFMRQYQQPLGLRKLRTAWDVLRESNTPFEEHTSWPDRIWIPWIDGRVLPLSAEEWSVVLPHKSVKGPKTSECLLGYAGERTKH